MTQEQEQEPLIDYGDNWEYADDGCIPESLKRNRIARYSLISICTIVATSFIYLMIFVLPNLAPDAVEIPTIELVKNSQFYLHPLAPLKPGKRGPKDSESPNKRIPLFNEWQYSDNLELVDNHFSTIRKEYNIGNEKSKRVILIGDVHGMLKELKQLLHSISYDGGSEDKVVLLGDFIDKGPNSIEVLDFAISNNIGCVLGNHELEILKRYSQIRAVNTPAFHLSQNETDESSSVDISEHYNFDEMMKIAKKLTPDHIQYLASCPVIMPLGPVAHYINKKQTKNDATPALGVAVHGGLIWSKKFEDQDPIEVLTMRNLLPPNWDLSTDDRHETVGGLKSKSWSKVWNQKQREIIKNSERHSLMVGTKVFYGHDAKRSLSSKEFSLGLDSGCVYGKQLSGTMIWAEVEDKKGLETIIYKSLPIEVNC